MTGRAAVGDGTPALETVRVAQDSAEWAVWSTTARIVVTDPAALAAAYALVVDQLAAVDAAASRFRDDSEIMALDRTSGRPQQVSPLLAELVRAALAAARDTDGDVDPTLGSQLQALGYDRDYAALDTGPSGLGSLFAVSPQAAGPGPGLRSVSIDLTGSRPVGGSSTSPVPATRTGRAPSWREVVLAGTTLTLPPGVLLDLGATAKGWAADRCARIAAERTGAGVLVSLGGDIATAGPGPSAGWQVRVSDGDDQPQTSIALPAGSAIATSSTIRRTWAHAGRRAHHILDPRTGLPAEPVWRTVTVAAPTCVTANTLSTAAIVRGRAASRWLDSAGVSARFVSAAGTVLTVGGWPAERG